MEIVAHGEYARQDDAGTAGKTARHGGKMKLRAYPVEQTSDEARQGIDFCSEDKGNFIQEDIADDAAACSRQGSHHHRHPHRLSRSQCFFDADDGEHAKTHGVE